MYFQNVGYAWSEIDGATTGAIFRPSMLDSEGSLRRERPLVRDVALFDPQLYFLNFDLTPEDHSGLLSRLATYPWFGVRAPEYDSGLGTRTAWASELKEKIAKYWNGRQDPLRNWRVTVEAAVAFQIRFGMSAVILPATLIADPESDLEADLHRLDEALAVAKSLTALPLYASVPLDESAVRHRELGRTTIVEALVDSLAAREALAGVYVPVSQSAAGRDRISSQRVAAAVLQISKKLGGDAGLKVVVNFVESLGIFCRALGAYGYGSGYSQKARRLAVGDLKEKGGGSPLPKFHSHSTLMDFYPERDLERLQAHRLLKYFKNDRTGASANLLDALRSGARSASVAQWEERRANVAAAKVHYAQLHQKAEREPASAEDGLAWLQEAEANWIYLADRFRLDPLEAADGKHLTPWRAAFEEVMAG